MVTSDPNFHIFTTENTPIFGDVLLCSLSNQCTRITVVQFKIMCCPCYWNEIKFWKRDKNVRPSWPSWHRPINQHHSWELRRIIFAGLRWTQWNHLIGIIAVLCTHGPISTKIYDVSYLFMYTVWEEILIALNMFLGAIKQNTQVPQVDIVVNCVT